LGRELYTKRRRERQRAGENPTAHKTTKAQITRLYDGQGRGEEREERGDVPLVLLCDLG
jgi:hypothetical protein